MPAGERDLFSHDLDTLGQRIEARAREFSERGEFADAQRRLAELDEECRRLRERLDTAQGEAWHAAKDELTRAHGEIYDDLVKLERKLDAEMMKANPSGRAPGARSGLV